MPQPQLMYQADINASASGDNTVVAAVTGRKVKVYKLWLVATGAVNVKFKNGASTDFNATAVPLTGAGAAIFFAYDDQSYWETTDGNAFIVNLSGAVGVTGRIYYTLS